MSAHFDPFFHAAGGEVQAIAGPFLRTHRLNYFQYARVFADGSFTFLVNRVDFVEARFGARRGVKSYVDPHSVDAQNFHFLWNGSLPTVDTDIARDCGLDNGLCFVDRQPQHYDLVAFAAPPRETHAVNFYLNNIQSLKHFIASFHERAKPLIDAANARRITLTGPLQDENNQQLLWRAAPPVRVRHDGKPITLGRREWQSLEHLSLGRTVKETAAHMGLSPRTVETYLQRVKTKLGVTGRSDLVRAFHSCAPL